MPSPTSPVRFWFVHKAVSCTYARILAATAALRRKKMHEADLDKLNGTRLQLEMQVNTLESANMNANTLDVMRKGASALKGIHDGLYVFFKNLPHLNFAPSPSNFSPPQRYE